MSTTYMIFVLLLLAGVGIIIVTVLGGGGNGGNECAVTCKTGEVCTIPNKQKIIQPTVIDGKVCCKSNEVCYDYSTGYCSANGPVCTSDQNCDECTGPWVTNVCYPYYNDGPCGMVWNSSQCEIAQESTDDFIYGCTIKMLPFAEADWTTLKTFTLDTGYITPSGPKGKPFSINATDLYGLKITSALTSIKQKNMLVATSQENVASNTSTVYCCRMPEISDPVWDTSLPNFSFQKRNPGDITDVTLQNSSLSNPDNKDSLKKEVGKDLERAWCFDKSGSVIKGIALCFRIIQTDAIMVDGDTISTQWSIAVVKRNLNNLFPINPHSGSDMLCASVGGSCEGWSKTSSQFTAKDANQCKSDCIDDEDCVLWNWAKGASTCHYWFTGENDKPSNCRIDPSFSIGKRNSYKDEVVDKAFTWEPCDKN